jgi:hypothetical protein
MGFMVVLKGHFGKIFSGLRRSKMKQFDPNVVNWLLEEDNPSVRYLTLKNLLDKTEDDYHVKQSKECIMTRGAVLKILEKQDPSGYWVSLKDFYVKTKYKGTVWSLILLAELWATGTDERIRKACEIILNRSQDKENGGFCYRESKTESGGDPAAVLPCLTGNMVFSLIRFGYLNDPRVQKGIEWITKYQRFDDGDTLPPKAWPYHKFETCWGKHTCYLGVVKALKALAEIPSTKRTTSVNSTIDRCIEYILKHRIYKRSHEPDQIANDRWTQLAFPRMWNTDFLEILLLLTQFGVKDVRMQDAVKLLEEKQLNGKWILEKTYNGRYQTRIEQKGNPSKWLTLGAITVLKLHRTHSLTDQAM